MFTITIQCCDPEDKGCEETCDMEAGGQGDEGYFNFRIHGRWKVGTFAMAAHDGGWPLQGIHFACPSCSFKT